jgi:hypothetical protein
MKSHLRHIRTAAKLLLLPVAAVAAPTHAQNLPATRVVVDIGRNTSLGSMSFDELILLVGPAPAEMDSLFLRLRTIGRREAPDCSVSSQEFTNARSWRRDRNPGADSFNIYLDPLSPDRRYLLCLRSVSRLSPSAAARFQEAMVRRLDQTLRDRTVAGDSLEFSPLTVDSFTAIRKDLIAAVPRGPGQTVTGPTGSIFLETTSDSIAREEILVQLLALQQPYIDRLVIVSRFNTVTDSAVRLLRHYQRAQMNTLTRISSGVQWHDSLIANSDVETARVLETIRYILTPPPGFLDRVAQGLSIPGDSGLIANDAAFVSPDDAWTLQDLQPRLDNLRRTQERLDGVRVLAAMLVTNEVLRRRIGLDANASQSLLAETDSIRLALADVRQNLVALGAALTTREQKLAVAARSLTVRGSTEAVALTSSVEPVFETRAQRYVTAELGLLYAFQLKDVTPFFGVNFYPSGINKRVPQRLANPLSRFGIMVGVTATSIAKEEVRDDLFGNSALLAGGSLRFFDFLHLSAGGMLFRGLHSSETAEDSDIHLVPFTSLSFDLDLKKLFGGVADALSP